MCAYTVYRFIYMIGRVSPNITKTTLIRPPEEDEPFRPYETGFDFAFGLDGPSLDPHMGYFTVRFINQTVIDTERVKTKTDLKFTKCGTENFAFND